MVQWMAVGHPGVDRENAARLRQEAVKLSKAGAQMVRLIQSRRRQNARDAAPAKEKNLGATRGPRTAPAEAAQAPAPAGTPRAPAPAAARAAPARAPTDRGPADRGTAGHPVARTGAAPATQRPLQTVADMAGLSAPADLGDAIASVAATLSRSGLLSSVAHSALQPAKGAPLPIGAKIGQPAP
jgi:hypothetical protein